MAMLGYATGRGSSISPFRVDRRAFTGMFSPFAAIVISLLLAPSMSFAADFGSLLKSLQDSIQKKVQPPPANVTTAPQGGQTAQSSGGFGAKATESYCRNLFSVAAISKKTPVDESLVSEEFNVSPKDFFDTIRAALDAKPGFTSYTFPSPSFYQNEFETDKINVLFNLLLSYPSPQYAAALISEARKQPNTPQFDPQVRVDAIAALAILHFRMQDKLKKPDRWKDLVNALAREEHYTGYVIRARLLKSGELGQTDVNEAIRYASDANGLTTKYRQDNGYRTFSTRNYAITSNQTLYEILAANPAQAQRGFMLQFVRMYEGARNAPNLAPELQAKLGPELGRIEQASRSAAKKAGELLTGATEASRIKAEKAALESTLRTRTSDTSDVNVDIGTMATLAHEMEKVDKLDDVQKQRFASALQDAHESGDRAVAMMPRMLEAMLSLVMQRGIGAVPAMVPYALKLQTYSDNACTVISRWDHAAQVTNTPMGQDADSRSNLASLVAKGGD